MPAPARLSGACFQFSSTGTCSFGTRCKYAHVANAGTTAHASHAHQRRKKPRTKRAPRSGPDSHLAAFFAQYPAFPHDGAAPATTNFHALCDFFAWATDDPARVAAHGRFKDALVREFNGLYGTAADDVGCRYALCRVLRIAPIPDELEACRRAVQRTHVNLVDLVDRRADIAVFGSVEALSACTKDAGKFFPREHAHAGGVLKYLLRQILNPPASPAARRRRRRA